MCAGFQLASDHQWVASHLQSAPLFSFERISLYWHCSRAYNSRSQFFLFVADFMFSLYRPRSGIAQLSLAIEMRLEAVLICAGKLAMFKALFFFYLHRPLQG